MAPNPALGAGRSSCACQEAGMQDRARHRSGSPCSTRGAAGQRDSTPPNRATGRELGTSAAGQTLAADWDGRDLAGQPLASGVHRIVGIVARSAAPAGDELVRAPSLTRRALSGGSPRMFSAQAADRSGASPGKPSRQPRQAPGGRPRGRRSAGGSSRVLEPTNRK